MDKIFKLEDLYVKLVVDDRCWFFRKIWNIFENLSEMFFGRVWYYFLGFMIVLSIVCIVVELMFLFCDDKYFCKNYICGRNLFQKGKENDLCDEIEVFMDERVFFYFVFESICVVIFIFEYFL